MRKKFPISNFQFPKNSLEEQIFTTLKYFFFFDYPLSMEEIHTFVKKKAQKRQITSILEKMEKKSLLKSWKLGRGNRNWLRSGKKKQEFSFLHYIPSSTSTFNARFYPHYQFLFNSSNLPRYTLTQYPNNNITIQQYNNLIKRQNISKNKLNSWKFRLYINLLALFPQIKLAGLSGSVAMLNASEEHDVDLFIITAKNRLFTGRFIALILAQILGLRRTWRSSAKPPLKSPPYEGGEKGEVNNFFKDKVCLNLFFAESDLAVPKFKRSDYVAHEVLQMKPLVEKNSIYLRFIDANRWVFDIFPNAKNDYRRLLTDYHRYSYPRKSVSHPRKSLIDKIESALRNLQLHFIRKHRTTEIVTDNQLWFHPEDFKNKIKSFNQPRLASKSGL